MIVIMKEVRRILIVLLILITGSGMISADSGNEITLIDFGSEEIQNTYGFEGWSVPVKDEYTGYCDIGPGGTAITVGTEGSYNFQGIKGKKTDFFKNEIIKVSWYNNSADDITFTPRISFNDPNRILNDAPAGKWYDMDTVTVPANSSAQNRFEFGSATAGRYSVVNVNNNFDNRERLVCDKIELVKVSAPECFIGLGNFDVIFENPGDGAVIPVSGGPCITVAGSVSLPCEPDEYDVVSVDNIQGFSDGSSFSADICLDPGTNRMYYSIHRMRYTCIDECAEKCDLRCGSDEDCLQSCNRSCENTCGRGHAWAWGTICVTFEGTGPPPEVDLSVEPAIIKKGESAVLSWNSANSDTCTIEPDIGTVDTNGSVPVSPTENTEYIIKAAGPGGIAVDRVTVAVDNNSPPGARPGGPCEVKKGTSVRFDGSMSYDPDGDDLIYSWDFGDSSPAETGVSATHAYTSGGNYQAILTVDDGRGGTDSATTLVWVTDTDLELADIDLSGVSADSQSLKLTGTAAVSILNSGTTPAEQGYDVILFEDTDNDGLYSASGDSVIGVTAVSEEHAGGVMLTLPISVNSVVLFSGNRIFAFADSKDAVDETDETDNITHTMADCGVSPSECTDLTASRVRADRSGYPDSVKITARFGNGGTLHIAPGADMSFYDGDPGAGGTLLGTAATTRQLNPGEYEDLSLTLNSPQPEILTVYAAADDDGTGTGKMSETDEDNNIASGEFHIGNHAPVIISDAPEGFQMGQEALPPETMKLTSWDVIEYDCPGNTSANWVLSDEDTTATQKNNSDPSILVCDSNSDNDSDSDSDCVLQDDIIQGTWRVDKSGYNDDDFMGFVFGYQDRGRYYLFDWKRAGQITCRGMKVQIISMPVNSDCLSVCTASDGNILGTHDIGWQFDTDYKFRLEFHPGEFIITIMQTDDKGDDKLLRSFTVPDDTYLTGKFGFYNYSQDNVVYKSFTQEILPSDMYIYNVKADDPDGDDLTYTLKNSPDGMTVDPATGVITWTPADSQTGIHNVSVEVSDGKDGTDIQHYTLRVLSPIDAYPIIYGNPVVGSELTFTVSDPSGLTCEWDFGDGYTATGSEAVHTYAARGDYSIVLHLTDSEGRTADIPRTLHISTVNAPTASMSVSGYMTAGQAISFDGSGSYAQSGMIQSWNWNFGDGHTGAGPAVSHIYAEAGTYQAVLTVTDTNGLSSSASVSLMIGPNQGPVAGFGYSGVMADGNPITFDASAS